LANNLSHRFWDVYGKSVLYFVIATHFRHGRSLRQGEQIYEQDQAFTVCRLAKRELQ
jgi:hypothetical protein